MEKGKTLEVTTENSSKRIVFRELKITKRIAAEMDLALSYIRDEEVRIADDQLITQDILSMEFNI